VILSSATVSFRGLALGVTLALALAPLRPALAGDSALAKQRYERGAAAYNLGRFDDAIAAFSDAYEQDHAPILLFNIAQAHWKKGDSERALFFYRRYLEADPHASNRATVEARIQTLAAELEAAKTVEPAASHPAPAMVGASPRSVTRAAPAAHVDLTASAPPEVPVYHRVWFWGLVGAVAIGAAAVVVAATSSHRESWKCSDCSLGMLPLGIKIMMVGK
jgi:tetratricopeptide (TPR) repeat protein